MRHEAFGKFIMKLFLIVILGLIFTFILTTIVGTINYRRSLKNNPAEYTKRSLDVIPDLIFNHPAETFITYKEINLGPGKYVVDSIIYDLHRKEINDAITGQSKILDLQTGEYKVYLIVMGIKKSKE